MAGADPRLMLCCGRTLPVMARGEQGLNSRLEPSGLMWRREMEKAEGSVATELSAEIQNDVL